MALADDNTFIKAYEEMENGSRIKPELENFPVFEIVAGPRLGSWFSLNQSGDLTLGRAHVNYIVLDDNSVSRSHAIVRNAGGSVTIKDIGSRNGSYVNGQRIMGETELNHQDTVKLGIYTLRLLTKPTEQDYEPAADEKSLGDELLAPTVLESPELKTSEPEIKAQETLAPESLVVAAANKPVNTGGAGKRFGVFVLLLLIVTLAAGLTIYRKPLMHKVSQLLGDKQNKQSQNNKPLNTTPEQTGPKKISVLLEADAQPVRAKIFYEGKELGVTPFQVSLLVPMGQAAKFKAEYQLEEIGEIISEESSVQFNSADELKKLTFGANLASITAINLPKNGTLYLEASFAGKGGETKPLKIKDLAFGKPFYVPFGKYVAEIRESEAVVGTSNSVPKIKYRREFLLSANVRTYTLEVKEEDMRNFPAVINSTPAGAVLLIDGKKVGETPYKGTLPLGDHKMVLNKEGFEDKVVDLNMDLNTPYELNITLGTSAAGQYINAGREQVKLGKFVEATSSFIDALKHNPDPSEIGEINYLLGLAFLRSQNMEQAQSYFEKASKDKTHGQKANLGLAEVYFGQGQAGPALAKMVDLVLNSNDEKLKSDTMSLYSRLYPIKSMLYIATEPAGANVSVNGMAISQPAPLILSDLMVGTYRIKAELPGYKAVETRFVLDVSSIKPVVIKLERQ